MWSTRPQASSTHLGEEPPPLPVAQPEVGGAVPLEDFHGGQLLLPLGKCPAGEGHSEQLRVRESTHTATALAHESPNTRLARARVIQSPPSTEALTSIKDQQKPVADPVSIRSNYDLGHDFQLCPENLDLVYLPMLSSCLSCWGCTESAADVLSKQVVWCGQGSSISANITNPHSSSGLTTHTGTCPGE